MDLSVIDNFDNLYFILGNDQITIFNAVPIGSKAAVPLAFTSLLLTPSHCQRADIFTFNLDLRLTKGV